MHSPYAVSMWNLLIMQPLLQFTQNANYNLLIMQPAFSAIYSSCSLFYTLLTIETPNEAFLWNLLIMQPIFAIYSQCKSQFTHNTASFFCNLLILQPIFAIYSQCKSQFTHNTASFFCNLLILQPLRYLTDN